MGMLIDGEWHADDAALRRSGGRFNRQKTAFHNWITPDGSPGPGGEGGFPAEPDRYHLYVSYACPWAHRTLIFRKLKKLESVVSLSVVHHFLGADGWTFEAKEGATGDQVNNYDFLRELYQKADPRFTGRVTVPVLWDKKKQTIVSNESSEIIRMLNSAFDRWGDADIDFFPRHLREQIEAINGPVYDNVNNGVYKCGFATSQQAYDEAFHALFATLDEIEERLSQQRYLVGARLTEADWRLFTTLVRFDPVYVGHFKCNRQRIVDYPNLSNYTRELFQFPGVADTVNMEHIKKHYYQSQESINPNRIVALGPDVDYDKPHDRERLPVAQFYQ